MELTVEETSGKVGVGRLGIVVCDKTKEEDCVETGKVEDCGTLIEENGGGGECETGGLN